LPNDSVDAVFTAEAFHWYASEESVGEIVRVLRPRGGLAIFWNVDFGDPEPPMGDEVERVLDDAFAKGGAPGIGKVLSGFWREPISKTPFEPLRQAEVVRMVTRTRDQWLANMLSVSSIASLPHVEREELAQRLAEPVPDVEYRWSIRPIADWTGLGSGGARRGLGGLPSARRDRRANPAPGRLGRRRVRRRRLPLVRRPGSGRRDRPRPSAGPGSGAAMEPVVERRR